MWTRTKNRAGGSALLAVACLAVLAVNGCAANKKAERAAEVSQPAVINEIRVTSSGGETTVLEIVGSKSAPFTSFRLADPPRVVLDIRGKAGEELEASKRVYDPNVTHIRVEEGPAQALTTRIVVELARNVTYKAAQKDAVLTVVLTAEEAPPAAPPPVSKPADPARQADTAPAEAKDDRIFFEPRTTGMNEVLGLDFKMLDHGNSRLTIHTDKKARYDLRRKGSMDLVLALEKVSIRPLLMRHLDSTHFEGTVDRVFSEYSPGSGRLVLTITLREMVPYHLNQSDGALTMEFGATRVKPPDMKIVPLKVSETRTVKKTPAETETRIVPENGSVLPMAGAGAPKGKAAGVEGKWSEKKIPGMVKSRYTGQPMTMDFVNAEVTNILRLIGEVSDLNIIWSPEVKGTVSMRLKKVPWDQSLELILANNDLGMRRDGNVIWITTRAHLNRIESEEKKKRQDERNQQIKMRQDLQKAKEAEPLETAYMPLDFAEAKKIMAHIVKSKRGTLKVDERTNTIIMETWVSSGTTSSASGASGKAWTGLKRAKP
ncbi:MAG: AMIN domain-containing protein [Deltaproteobacteria bacterium]|nr:AMIN domain-containing protein [Deltaproteobacteria bacterium]